MTARRRDTSLEVQSSPGRPLGRQATRRLLDSLFTEAGLAGAIRFGTQQEGTLLIGSEGRPIESLSGFAIGGDGTVYRFWLGLDSAGQFALQPLTPVGDIGVLADDPEYLAAVRRLKRRKR